MSDKLDSFEIILKPFFHDGKKFRMKVDVTYISEQVMRFRVYAGEKYLIMEKHLLSKAVNPWKVPDTNIDLIAHGVEKANYTLYEIQEHLEAYIKPPRTQPPTNPKYEH